MIKAIAAMSKNRVIGVDGDLPWHIPEDMKHVSALTRGHFVLMGRRTYFSLPERFRPLPGRTSIVLTRDKSMCLPPEVFLSDNLSDALEIYFANSSGGQALWVFGGGQIYEATKDLWQEVHLTLVNRHVVGDTKFPSFEVNFDLVASEDHDGFSFQHFKRKGANP
jgi:dihydrofolate reductase